MRIRIIRYLDLAEKKPTGFCHYDVDDGKRICRGRMHESEALDFFIGNLRFI